MNMFDSYTPVVQQISIDEAFLDLSGTTRLFGDPVKTAGRLKQQVFQETGLTLSVGIAPNKYLAKMASDFDKPDGLYQVEEGQELAFLDKLELKDLWGVGKKTLEHLYELNITSVARLREFSEGLLKSMLGEGAGSFLYNAARGIDPGIFSEQPKSHSISNEITFEQDTRDRDTIVRVLLDISHQVMFRMLEERCKTKTVFLKLRFSDFTTTTVQKTVRHYIHSADEFYDILMELLRKRWDGANPVRLIGAGAGSVEAMESPDQPELFEQDYDKKKKVEKAVFDIRSKLSGDSVVKASLLEKQRRRRDENNSS
jgi:DNA polymerase-4